MTTSVKASFENYGAVVPSDTVEQPMRFDGIQCNSDGVVMIATKLDATPVKFTAVAGSYIQARGRVVFATGTTAVDLTWGIW